MVAASKRSGFARVMGALAVLTLMVACSSTVEVELTRGPDGTTGTATPAPTAGPGDDSPGGGTIGGFVPPSPDPTLLPVDQELLVGRLENGLTYYLRRNRAPGRSLQLRLVVDAGSMQQEVADSGQAHFLEHMLFNGTEKYPDNSLDEVLRGFGMEFGADVNAYTSYDETVYILSVPDNDDESVDTAFEVLREWAGNATLDPDQVVAERGVIVEEARLRSGSPFAAIEESFDYAYTKETPYEDRSPIGSDANIRATDAADVLDFYRQWYRPDLMAVVAVGDVPVSELEDRVVDLFSDLEVPAGAPERTETRVGILAEPHVEVLHAPEQPDKFISIDFSLPAWNAGSSGGERLMVIEDLMGSMVQTRLAESSSTGASDLVDPFAGPFGFSRERAFFGFNADADDLAEGTSFILREMHRLRVTGFDDDEFERAVSSYRAALRSELASAATTQDHELAGLYVAHYLEGADISSVEDRTERLEALLDALRPADVDNYLRWMMAVSAPIVILVAPDLEALPSEAELLSRVEAAEAEGLAAADVDGPDVETIDELMTPPAPADPADSGRIPNVDGSRWWRFENGVTVGFVPSAISAGAIDLFASSEGGWSLLSPDERPLSRLATQAVAGSGLADISKASLDRFLVASTAWVRPYIDEVHEGFFGGADVDDLETLLQLLHLLVTAPRVDDVGVRSARSTAEDQLRAAGTDPDEILFAALVDAAYAGDPYQTALNPTREQIDALEASSLLDLYRSRLGKVDDLVVVIVGDASDDEVEDLAREYLGTLPRGTADTWRDTTPSVSADVERVIEFGDPDDPGGLALLHSVEIEVDLEMEIAGQILEEALSARLNDIVREQFGATYGASVFFDVVREPDELVQLLVFVDGDPNRMELIAATVEGQISELATDGIESDELARAVAVINARLDFIDNGFLTDQVIEWWHEPDTAPVDRDDQTDALDGISASDVDELADRLFAGGARVEIVRVPVG